MKLYKFKLKLVKLLEEQYKDKRGRNQLRPIEKTVNSKYIIAESREAAVVNFEAQNKGLKVKWVYLVEEVETKKEVKQVKKIAKKETKKEASK